MKSEIRDLQAGHYLSSDGSLLLVLKKTDNGVSIEIADYDADIFYAANVNDKNCKFEVGSISSQMLKDKETNDGADET